MTPHTCGSRSASEHGSLGPSTSTEQVRASTSSALTGGNRGSRMAEEYALRTISRPRDGSAGSSVPMQPRSWPCFLSVTKHAARRS